LEPIDLVMQSFGRCCANDKFFDDFYDNFFASSAKIRDKFINTDMEAQKRLLRQGILNLLLYARGMPDTKLQALAKSHNKNNLNIAPDLYEFWLDALIQTIKKYDVNHSSAMEAHWLDILNKGIAIIKEGYDKV